MSEVDTGKAGDMNKAMTEAGKALKALWLNIGGAIAPIITEIARKAATIVGTTTLWIRENQPLLATVFKIAAAVVGIGTAMVTVGSAMSAIVSIGGVMVGVVSATVAAVTALVTSGAAIPLVIAGIGACFLYEFGMMKDAMAYFSDTWMAAWNGIVASVMKGDLQTAFDIVWVAIQITWQKGVNWILSLWRGTLDTLKMGWRGTGNFMLHAFGLVVLGIKNHIAVIVAQFDMLVRTIKIAWEVIKNPRDIGSVFSKLQTAAQEVDNKLKQTLQRNDAEYLEGVGVRQQASQEAYEADQRASQAAYDAGVAKVADLTNRMNELIAKANEPLIATAEEKKIERQAEALKAVKNLASPAGGLGSFSGRALQRGQALGDKVINQIKQGVDFMCGELQDLNDNVELMAGPG